MSRTTTQSIEVSFVRHENHRVLMWFLKKKKKKEGEKKLLQLTIYVCARKMNAL